MGFSPLPPRAAFQHRDVREGFEVVFPRSHATGHHVAGHATGVEESAVWAVRYEIELDARWHTRRARVWSWSSAGAHELVLEHDGAGRWHQGGRELAELAGCYDVDLEASALTNTFPIHRLALDVGQRASAPAAYVRTPTAERAQAALERLEQSYERLADDGARLVFDYAAPRFDYQGRLFYDAAGLILDYPGIAVRSA